MRYTSGEFVSGLVIFYLGEEGGGLGLGVWDLRCEIWDGTVDVCRRVCFVAKVA